jgi:A/G-specific adenine glycosylase
MDKRYFSDKLVEWYSLNKRDLPWRDTKDPYKIWLSEVILQQTRVNQGMPYYLKFVEKFPDIRSLASASEQEILRLWQGLGYYTRARNLHQCAREVVNDHHAIFPNDFQTLKKLRGIGDYTAAAISSFSNNEKVAVVDGNVFRVLSRVFGINNEINSPEGKKVFSSLANELICSARPDLHNQAIMEFGALQCVPRNPDCNQCIFLHGCFAVANSMQDQLPVKVKPKVSRKRYFYYFVIQKGNSLLMKKREGKDIWHGLFDFLLLEKKSPTGINKLVAELNADTRLSIHSNSVKISGLYKHSLSHQTIYSKFILVEEYPKNLVKEPFEFYSAKKINSLPKPVLISRFLADYNLL